jgi:hypothetical protein
MADSAGRIPLVPRGVHLVVRPIPISRRYHNDDFRCPEQSGVEKRKGSRGRPVPGRLYIILPVARVNTGVIADGVIRLMPTLAEA